jgi:hypothetical protein
MDSIAQAALAEQDSERILAAIRTRTSASPSAQRAIAAFHAETAGLQVEEWDTSTLDERLRDGYLGHYLERKDGTRILVVPAGQDPVVRLHAVRALLAHPGVTA